MAVVFVAIAEPLRFVFATNHKLHLEGMNSQLQHH